MTPEEAKSEITRLAQIVWRDVVDNSGAKQPVSTDLIISREPLFVRITIRPPGGGDRQYYDQLLQSFIA